MSNKKEQNKVTNSKKDEQTKDTKKAPVKVNETERQQKKQD
ncbi:hypothetical protein [Oenococcus sicerae]|nr:hypothetical protein [Oenococcus sicerae]